jgi:hypothetical protein
MKVVLNALRTSLHSPSPSSVSQGSSSPAAAIAACSRRLSSSIHADLRRHVATTAEISYSNSPQPPLFRSFLQL